MKCNVVNSFREKIQKISHITFDRKINDEKMGQTPLDQTYGTLAVIDGNKKEKRERKLK